MSAVMLSWVAPVSPDHVPCGCRLTPGMSVVNVWSQRRALSEDTIVECHDCGATWTLREKPGPVRP